MGGDDRERELWRGRDAPRRIELDVIEFGGPHDGPPGRRWPRWLALGLVVAAVAAAVAVDTRRGRGEPMSAAPTPAPSGAPSDWPATGASGSATPSPSVSQFGHALLGVSAGWELFGRGSGVMVRIEFARGRITRTAVPELQSGGPVSFVVGRDWALIRPLDRVPGFAVPDGRPARPLGGALDQPGPAMPGPDQEHVWMPSSGDDTKMILVDSSGRPSGTSVPLPPGANHSAAADAAGYLLFTGTGGTYSARPDGLRRITTGDLLAAGPTRWLALQCDVRYRCGAVVIDRRTGAHHRMHAFVDLVDHFGGVISPDGRTAALLESDPSGALSVHLLSLASGATSRLDVSVEPSFDNTTMVWSPDSRWLFIAGGGGTLYPVDTATGRVHDLGVTLPAITQLAVRPAP